MSYPKMIASLIATVAMVLLVVWGGFTVYKWRQGAMQNEARGRTMTATEGLIQDGSQADAGRRGQEATVTGARFTYDTTMTEAENNDEATRNWRNAPVPDSVRRAAKARRLARERSADDGGQP